MKRIISVLIILFIVVGCSHHKAVKKEPKAENATTQRTAKDDYNCKNGVCEFKQHSLYDSTSKSDKQ